MIVVVAAVVAVLLGVFLRSFRLGVAMRAVVDDPDLVAMAGAKPHRMAQMGWALGFMLAALAGVLIAPLVGQTGLTSTQLTLLALNGFAAAVVGRLRNLPMTFVGALMLGLITQYCVGYLPGHINAGLAAVLTEVVPVLFLFVVLLVIPAARLAPAGRLAVRPAPRVVTARQSVAGAVLLVAGMAVLAVLAGATALATLSQGLAFGIVGLSLVLLVGYAGQVSLCQLTFMGIGAFTMGKVLGGGSWWGAPGRRRRVRCRRRAGGAARAPPARPLPGAGDLRLRRGDVHRVLQQLERHLGRDRRSGWAGCGCRSCTASATGPSSSRWRSRPRCAHCSSGWSGAVPSAAVWSP